MKIALHQFNPTVGALCANTDKLITAVNRAKADNCNLFVTSELAICGYPPEDLLFSPDFYSACIEQLTRLQQINDITMLIGCPYTANGNRYNSVFVLYNGNIINRYDKSILPNYGVFDEQRYFTPGSDPIVFGCNGAKIGVIICEDIWQANPVSLSKNCGAEVICVVNASPYDINKYAERVQIVKQRVVESNLPVIYVNQWGGQDELVFDGASFALNADGNMVVQCQAFTDQLVYVNYNSQQLTSMVPLATYLPKLDSIYTALVVGVRDYIDKNGFKGALLGLSGGIDSALTLAIAVDALGAERVMAVMMPSIYTADISLIDARDMVKRLNVRYEEITIESVFEQFKTSLSTIFAGLSADTTEENLQARARGTLLMAISNKLGFLVLTTGNKSEMATGYATLYGDMAGGYAVLKDVLKTVVYDLSNWRNSIKEVIPQRIITRPPSAELRDNQTDQDSLPDYPVLDAIIELLVEKKLSCQNIVEHGFNSTIVDKVAKLLRINEYKRRQAAIGPKITAMSFAKDWRYPITNRFKD